MSESLVSLCNHALIRIGAATISSFEDRTEEARLCRLVYPQERKFLLSKHDWTFARKYQSLSLVSTDFLDWAFVYQFPADCLRMVELYSGLTCTDPALRIPYRVRVSKELEQTLLLTNEENATAVYIADVDNVALFTSQFRETLVQRMAMILAMPLKQSLDVASLMQQQYDVMFAVATASDANSEQNEVLSDNVFVKARR